MRRISITQHSNQRISPLPRVVSLWRLEPRDNQRYRYSRFFGWNTLEWQEAESDRYRTAFRSSADPNDLSRSFGYYFEFEDGTKGACPVRYINRALRALGCSIDMDAEPTDERR